MKRCTRCGLPETHETISFDSEGVCNICRQHEFKKDKINWSANKKVLDGLIEEHRGKYDYDCIVSFSGGNNITWTLYYQVKEYGVKPLVVRFDHGFMRPNLEENVKRTVRNLGVNIMSFTPNWKVVRKLMLQSFLEKRDFCWHCHTGIFSYLMWVAIEKKVLFIFWGEPSAEYTAYFSYGQQEEVDAKCYNRYVNLGICADDMVVRLGGAVEKRDLKPCSCPSLKELRPLNYLSVCLGTYIPWDVKMQSGVIQSELGWKGGQVENVPPQYQYEKIECYMQGVRDFIERGYSRPSRLVALDVRNGRLSNEDGDHLVEAYEGRRPPRLDLFLAFVGLTEPEFRRSRWATRSHLCPRFGRQAVRCRHGRLRALEPRWGYDMRRRRRTARSLARSQGRDGGIQVMQRARLIVSVIDYKADNTCRSPTPSTTWVPMRGVSRPRATSPV